ncbi:MAG: hypothetical protein MUE42_07465 [Opitutaceae bacterium]|jgi:hypothetical protein|nr:hypothetical protein [Opitutaceae bacterium]
MKPLLLLALALCGLSMAHALELTLSVLSPEKADIREAAFSPRVRVAEEQQQFDSYTAKDLLPLYSERLDGKIRALYVEKPKGCAFWTFAGMDGTILLKRHEKHRKEGFVLVSCVAVKTDLGQEYWATWVSEDSEKAILREMRRFGISQAAIKK